MLSKDLSSDRSYCRQTFLFQIEKSFI